VYFGGKRLDQDYTEEQQIEEKLGHQILKGTKLEVERV
jgi:hypothetical protein